MSNNTVQPNYSDEAALSAVTNNQHVLFPPPKRESFFAAGKALQNQDGYSFYETF